MRGTERGEMTGRATCLLGSAFCAAVGLAAAASLLRIWFPGAKGPAGLNALPVAAALGFLALAIAVPLAASDGLLPRRIGAAFAGASLLASIIPLVWHVGAALDVFPPPREHGGTTGGLQFSIGMLVLSASIIALSMRRKAVALGCAVLGLSGIAGVWLMDRAALTGAGEPPTFGEIPTIALALGAMLLSAVLLALDEPDARLSELDAD